MAVRASLEKQCDPRGPIASRVGFVSVFLSMQQLVIFQVDGVLGPDPLSECPPSRSAHGPSNCYKMHIQCTYIAKVYHLACTIMGKKIMCLTIFSKSVRLLWCIVFAIFSFMLWF